MFRLQLQLCRQLFLIVVTVFFTLGFTACDEEDGAEDEAEEKDSLIFIETSELPAGRVLKPYNLVLEVSDADGSVNWTVSVGELPPGLELSSEGKITGHPEQSGIFEFTIEAQDNLGFDDIDLNISIPKVLLMSGFEPFGSVSTNPSWDALIPLHDQLLNGLDVRIIEIPVTWALGWTTLRQEIERLNADIVVATGVAGFDFMSIETSGQNVMKGTDNDGVYKSLEAIVEGGADTIPDGLPAQAIADAMNTEDYPAQISVNAGQYLCNHVMYNLMHYVTNQTERAIPAGFIHVPPVPSSSLFTLKDITSAHLIGIRVISDWIK